MVAAQQTQPVERARAGRFVSFVIAASCVGFLGAASAQWVWVDPHSEVYPERIEYDLDAHGWRESSGLPMGRLAPRRSYEGLHRLAETQLAGGGWIIATLEEERTQLLLVRANGERRVLVSPDQRASRQLPRGTWSLEAFEQHGEYVVHVSGSEREAVVRIPPRGEPTVRESTTEQGCVTYALVDRFLALCNEHAQYEIDADGTLTSVGSWWTRPRYCDGSLGQVDCDYETVNAREIAVHVALSLGALMAFVIALVVHLRWRPRWWFTAAGVVVAFVPSAVWHALLWMLDASRHAGGLFLM
jgi:hypothetical protein